MLMNFIFLKTERKTNDLELSLEISRNRLEIFLIFFESLWHLKVTTSQQQQQQQQQDQHQKNNT
jgi:hypothetical protein